MKTNYIMNGDAPKNTTGGERMNGQDVGRFVNKILNGDALTHLKELPSEFVNTIMTSPPYWALRDYGSSVETIWDGKENCEHEWNENIQAARGGYSENSIVGNNALIKREPIKSNFCSKCNTWKGQLGLEPTFDLYIKHLCDIFNEVKRVLRKDGTCFVNLGDTYYGGNKDNEYITSKIQLGNKGSQTVEGAKFKEAKELPSKSLCMIPFRFAIEMVNRGWILRNTIIWHKPNVMPSSVKDRFTVDFEYLFFFVKNKKYFFETQYEEIAESSFNDNRKDKGLVPHKSGKSMDIQLIHGKTKEQKLTKQDLVGNPTYTGFNSRYKESQYAMNGTSINSYGRNKRAVWKITTKPFKEAHFAVYPEELCETPIKAGCPEFICNKCAKPRESIFEGTSNEAFNIRVRDVKEDRIKHIDRIANEEEIENYEEGITHVGEGRKFKELTDCGCNVGFSSGIVLDPFFGAGTTGLVALKQNKKFIGIELNENYISIAKERLKPYLSQLKLEDFDKNV